MQSRYFKRMYEKIMASFYFRSSFLCFKRPIKKIRINSKIPCPQSPSFFVPRPCRLRETKRAMGTTMMMSSLKKNTNHAPSSQCSSVQFRSNRTSPQKFHIFHRFSSLKCHPSSLPYPPLLGGKEERTDDISDYRFSPLQH